VKRLAVFYKKIGTYGGQEKVVWNFLRYLSSKGYRVDVWTMKVEEEPEGVRIHRVFVPVPFRGLKTLIFALYSFLKGRRIKEADKNTVIFGFGKTFYQDIFRAGGGVHKFYVGRADLRYRGWASRMMKGIRRFFSLSHWVNLLIEKLTFESGSLRRVIVPTEFVRRQIIENYRVKPEKIVVIRNGVDLERFNYRRRFLEKSLREELGISGDFIFSFVSTNHRLKGLDYLLDAVRVLKEKGYRFRLIVAGSGSDGYFRGRIATLGIGDFVVWMGRVREVERVYFSSDVLVYPSLFDASANVVLESMASGTPVIASVYSGTHELITPYVDGLLIEDPTNVGEIAERMRFVLENRKVLGDWGRRAAEKVKRYPAEEVFERYEKVILET